MSYSDCYSWHQEMDEFFDRCATLHDTSEHASNMITRELRRLLETSPQIIRRYFDVPDDVERGNLQERGACDIFLLNVTRRVGLLLSRAPSGSAMATVSIAPLKIERTARCDGSLAIAIAGAIAASALAIIDIELDPNRSSH